MARRKREHAIDTADLAVQLGLLVLGLISLAIGSIGLAKGFGAGGNIAGSLAFTGAGIGVLWLVARTLRQKSAEARSRPPFRPPGWTPPVFPLESSGTPFPMFSPGVAQPVAAGGWTAASVLTALGEIDWYQFERFCAALLRTEGYEVVRKGSAHADGGVDLLAEKAGERIFVQCKHWRTRVVKENTVHGLLGGMARLEAKRGLIYTLHGWAKPAAQFAESHAITLVDGGELAAQAVARLTPQQLTEILDPGLHHCPSCEAPMVWHEGTFRSLWGCSTAPRCQATLKHTGAR